MYQLVIMGEKDVLINLIHVLYTSSIKNSSIDTINMLV